MGGETTVERVLDDVASLGEVGGVSRVSSVDKDLVAGRMGQVELEGSIGGEEDVESTAKRLAEVVGQVGGRAVGSRVGVGVASLSWVLDVGVVCPSGVLLLVLVKPENEVQRLGGVLPEDEVALRTREAC